MSATAIPHTAPRPVSRWHRQRVRIAVTSLMAASLVLAACGSGGNDSAATGNLSGTIEISGSSTVEPITTWVAEEFELEEPDVRVNVDGPGTGDGFELFCRGETDMSNASRPIKAAEAETCANNGIEFIELKVAIDGLSVITNVDNTAVACLAKEDLYALLGPESQGINNWADAQALATELGSSTSLPNAPLTVAGPGEESGTFDSFVELALASIGKSRAEAGFIDANAADTSRPDYISQASDNVIIQNISGSPTSLGWVGYAFAEQAAGVSMIEIQDSDGNCVAATPDTISSGDYPLARDLYLYVNAESAEDPAVAAFVDFFMDNLVIAAEDVSYVALADEAIADTQTIWQARTVGTRDGG